MMDLDTWQAQNNAYLHAATSWVRLKLERAAKGYERPSGIASPMSAAQAERDHQWWSLFRRAPSDASPKSVPLLPSMTEGGLTEALERARRDHDTAAATEPAPALVALARQLGLSEFERDVLLLCVAMELDTRLAPLLAQVQDDAAKPYPTFALAMTLFDDPAWDALSPERPLRFWRLVEITQHAAQPITTSALRADERIVNYVKGLNYLDDRLTPLVVPVRPCFEDELPPSQRVALRRVLTAIGESTTTVASVALTGRDRDSKQRVASAAAQTLGLALYRLPAQHLPAQPGELETLARLWQRESLLLPIALYVDASDVDRASTAVDDPALRIPRFVARAGRLVFVDAPDAVTTRIDAVIDIAVSKPTPPEQQSAWAEALGDEGAELPGLLAGQFNLNQHDVESVVAEAYRGDADEPLAARVWRACLTRARPAVDRLAERIDAKAHWEDLVLPEPEAALLRQIAVQVRERSTVYDAWGFRSRMNRGLGISALFAGESGTGKTMAAEVLANDLALDLYRIDLSAVVSKYIGETEKNLRQLFDAAEDGGAILLFDEADALFGKRSEVKDSHDRYANIEINYLLQRVESYRGLAILATNMKSALDGAFMRRLRFIVNFTYPSPADRRRIWENAFPDDAPLGVLEYQRLARLNVTGGNIHSIAVNAAFLAAEARTPVTMAHVLDAARGEFRKLDRPINEADFRWADAKEVSA